LKEEYMLNSSLQVVSRHPSNLPREDTVNCSGSQALEIAETRMEESLVPPGGGVPSVDVEGRADALNRFSLRRIITAFMQ
jgi:hypothetical protein